MTHEERRERRKRIAERVEAGAAIADVAKKFRVTTVTVRQCCHEYDVEIADGRHNRPWHYAILADLLNTKDSYRAIAERHGVSSAWVGEVAANARDAGIKLRNGK